MIMIGAFDAKTHLSSLLDRVAQGEEILITKRGRPVARLVPAVKDNQKEIETAIQELRVLRSSLKLEGLSWKDLRDAGRR